MDPTVETVPVGQLMHVDRAVSRYVSTGHKVHSPLSAVSFPWYREVHTQVSRPVEPLPDVLPPVGQLVQSEAATPPGVVLYVFSGQSTHPVADCPPSDCNHIPGGHWAHFCPSPVLHVPGAHAVHTRPSPSKPALQTHVGASAEDPVGHSSVICASAGHALHDVQLSEDIIPVTG